MTIDNDNDNEPEIFPPTWAKSTGRSSGVGQFLRPIGLHRWQVAKSNWVSKLNANLPCGRHRKDVILLPRIDHMNHSFSGKPIAWTIPAHHWQLCLILGSQKFFYLIHHTAQASLVSWHCQQIQQQVRLVHPFMLESPQGPAKIFEHGHRQWWGLRRRCGIHLNEAQDKCKTPSSSDLWFFEQVWLG